MSDEQANANLAAALVAAQAEMPKVEADAVNPHFKSRFVSLDHLIAKTRPVLTKHGLAIVQFPIRLAEGQPGLATILLHASGESITAKMPLLLGKQDMQGLGAAITYARRYAWAALLGISEQEDDDGNEASRPARPAATKPAASPSAAGGTPKAPAPSSPGAAGAPLPTETQMVEYGKLLDAWKKLSPVFDKDQAVALALDKDGPWVIRATRRLQENIDREIEARKKAA